MSIPKVYLYLWTLWRIFLIGSTSSIDWVRIATEIELNYSAFDAFVILHGTDTMSYTASALSFMLEDLGKTVVRMNKIFRIQIRWSDLCHQIITGAQIPLSELSNDAVDNLLGALSIAGHFIIPGTCYQKLLLSWFLIQQIECCLYFNHCLYRGNRCSKISSYDLEAFTSPNFPPLVNGMFALFHLFPLHN